MTALTAKIAGQTVTSGQQIIPSIRLGTGTDYTAIEVWADTSATLTSAVAWLEVDSGGVAVAIAVPDATARAQSYAWALTPGSYTYSTPTSGGAGLALPDLAPGTKTVVVLRRVTTGGTVASPETNALRVTGTWT